jgi:hypothetical protein
MGTESKAAGSYTTFSLNFPESYTLGTELMDNRGFGLDVFTNYIFPRCV